MRPATRRRLGEPLPHQLPDRIQAHPEAPCGFTPSCEGDHLKLPRLSASYVRLWGRFLYITQPSAAETCPQDEKLQTKIPSTKVQIPNKYQKQPPKNLELEN